MEALLARQGLDKQAVEAALRAAEAVAEERMEAFLLLVPPAHQLQAETAETVIPGLVAARERHLVPMRVLEPMAAAAAADAQLLDIALPETVANKMSGRKHLVAPYLGRAAGEEAAVLFLRG